MSAQQLQPPNIFEFSISTIPTIINQLLFHTDVPVLCRDSFFLQARVSDSPLQLCCGPGDELQMIAAAGCTTLIYLFICHYRCFSPLRGEHSSQGNHITHWSQIHPPDFKAACLPESQMFSFTPPTRFISAVIIFNHQLWTFKWRFGLTRTSFQ